MKLDERGLTNRDKRHRGRGVRKHTQIERHVFTGSEVEQNEVGHSAQGSSILCHTQKTLQFTDVISVNM